jgi:uncharacterized membrane protein
MDSNTPITTPEPERIGSSPNGMVSLVAGLASWVIFFFNWLIKLPWFLAGLIALVAAILAIVFGTKAKRENPGSRAGKAGRVLGWLYIIGLVLAIVLGIAGLVLGISALSGLFS